MIYTRRRRFVAFVCDKYYRRMCINIYLDIVRPVFVRRKKNVCTYAAKKAFALRSRDFAAFAYRECSVCIMWKYSVLKMY